MSIAYPTPEQGRLAQPVMNRGTGGFAVNYSDNAQASRETGIPIEGFVQEAGAMGKVGEAAVNVSEYASKMADQMVASANREAIDKAEIFKAEGEMELASAMANEKDPLKWGDLSKQITAKWTEAALADKRIFPAARAVITQKMTLWDRGIGAQVIRSAHDQQLKKETAQLGGMVITAAHNARDPATARRLTQEGVERGIIGEDTAARWNIHIEEEEKKAQELQRANETIKLTNTQGPEAAKKYIDDSGADEVEKDRLTKTVERAEREHTAEVTQEFQDAVARGVLNPNDPSAVVTPKQVKEWRSWDPNVSDEMRALMMQHVDQYNNAMAREVARATAPEVSSRLLTQIRKLDPDKANDAQFMALRNQISMLPEGYRQLPYDVLTRKWRKYEGEETAAEKSMLNFGEKIMESMFDGEDFGKFREEKKKPDGTVYMAVNREAEQKALSAKQILGGKFNRYLQNTPNATEEDVRKWLKKNASAATRMRAADDWDNSPWWHPSRLMPVLPLPTAPDEPRESRVRGPRIDPSGIMNDLPDEAAGPPENILIPNSYVPE